MNVMSTLTVKFTAAALATVITAIGAWAFVSSSGTYRDPFHFAQVMAANARAHEGQLSLSSDRPIAGRTAVCRKGG